MPFAPDRSGQFNDDHLRRVREVVHRALSGDRKLGYLDEEDVAMEVAQHVAARLDRFTEDGPASLDTWIERVGQNKVRDIIERGRTKKRGRLYFTVSIYSDRPDLQSVVEHLTDTEPNPSATAVQSDLRRSIKSFIQVLPPGQRETLLAVHREETLQAAAHSLGIARSSLYGRLKTIAVAAEDFGLRCWLQPDA